MADHDNQYLALVETVLEYGVLKPNRTGQDSISIFGAQMRFDLRDGTIPLLTTKKMFTRGVIREILWYLQGDGNIKYLQEHGVSIWDEWAKPNGDLGPVYGVQWRKWPAPYLASGPWPEDQLPSGEPYYQIQYIDQIAQLIEKLKTNPNDRRLIVSAWNVGDLPDMALPPCHYLFQCYTRPLSEAQRIEQAVAKYGVDILPQIEAEAWRGDDFWKQTDIPLYELSLMLNQRSCDVGLGVPFNIVQYSILLRMLCEVVGMVPGDFIWSGGDVHIYTNHIDGLNTQLTREAFDAPTLKFARPITSIDDFKFEDFIIEGYQHHPRIDLDVAV